MRITSSIFDNTNCILGEGPFWHPLRSSLIWFDILNKKIFCKDPISVEIQCHEFTNFVSAAGWINYDQILVASESNLTLFNLKTKETQILIDLESSDFSTRSNDGRSDPWGGFWIGTMSKKAELEKGTIYRYFKGELRPLIPRITIPNAICFSIDRQYVYFADSARKKIWRQHLRENDGWPTGDIELFIDMSSEIYVPDGAVIDSENNLWNAHWGGWEVARYDQSGKKLNTFKLSTENVSCPAFGGNNYNDIFLTTAQENLTEDQLNTQPDAGKVFRLKTDYKGVAEYQIIL